MPAVLHRSLGAWLLAWWWPRLHGPRSRPGLFAGMDAVLHRLTRRYRPWPRACLLTAAGHRLLARRTVLLWWHVGPAAPVGLIGLLEVLRSRTRLLRGRPAGAGLARIDTGVRPRVDRWLRQGAPAGGSVWQGTPAGSGSVGRAGRDGPGDVRPAVLLDEVRDAQAPRVIHRATSTAGRLVVLGILITTGRGAATSGVVGHPISLLGQKQKRFVITS